MFYFKLAYQNIRKSLSIFAPFVLASTVLYTLLSSLFLIILSPIKNTIGTGGGRDDYFLLDYGNL